MADVHAFVEGQAALELSYSERGATMGPLPVGYRHDFWSADLGPYSPAAFDRAAQALRTWSVQAGAGMTVVPGGIVRNGDTFALVFRLPLAGYVLAAGRVVRVIDEPDLAGFAYGTLPGHPEQGEEAFTVARRAGRVIFEITAFSRPRHPLARIGAPLTRRLQVRANQQYIAAMHHVVG
jgi:uncharacterized protein (UPF0548 family)